MRVRQCKEKRSPTIPTHSYLVVLVVSKVGTSSVVYPAAGYAPLLAARGVPVAEFNLEETPVTRNLR